MKNTTKMNADVNTRPAIIPSNWACEDCPHFFREYGWTYRGRCLAQFEEGESVDVVYCDDVAPVCRRCAVEGFIARKCADDNRYHVRGDYGIADDGECYSLDHCNMNFYQCESCGTWVTHYANWSSTHQMCTDCAEERERELYRVIGNWHAHKGDFMKIGAASDPYTVGVEIEVEGYDVCHEDTAHQIIDKFGDAFVFEYDCSLYDGVEIISQPHTLEAFRALDLEGLERLLINCGYIETDDADTTGLHVHFSTAFLGDTNRERVRTLARLVRFYDKNFSFLCDMTERKDTGHSAPNESENYTYDYDDDYTLVERQIDGSRYVAVNCNAFDRGTIEIRLCDGTIRADKIRAWVNFNIALMKCLQEHNTLDVCDVVPYMSDKAISFFADSL